MRQPLLLLSLLLHPLGRNKPSRGEVFRTDRRTAPALRARSLRSYVSAALLLRVGAGLQGTSPRGGLSVLPEDTILPRKHRGKLFQPEPADKQFTFAQEEIIRVQPLPVQTFKVPLPF